MKRTTIMETQVQARVPAKAARFPPSPRAASRVALWPRLVPAVVSGGLLWMCYFPLAWGWLGWIALVPLLCLVRSPGRSWKTYACAWAGGLVFFVPALQWMRAGDHPMEYAWILLALYCALYVPAALYLMRRLDRHTFLPLLITVPLVWVALEWVRSFMLTGFSWYYLAHSQHDFLPVIQIADVAGAYGVSFLVAAFNAFVFELLYFSARFRDVCRLDEGSPAPSPARSLWLQGAAMFLVVAGTLFYGAWRLEQEADFTPGPRIALLQANVDQHERNQGLARRDFQKHYWPLGKTAINHLPRPELIIWPETSFIAPWFEVRPQAGIMPTAPEFTRGATNFRDLVSFVVRDFPSHHLLGLNSLVKDETGRDLFYNTALLIDPRGNAEALYHKNHRVPFGEYVPLRGWLPFLDHLSPTEGKYGLQSDDKFTRFALGDFHFGVLICFEDTVPWLAREYPIATQNGPPVDFLVNMSNDGWFDGTSEHEEHLAISRFRAVECRRAVVRSVNMGISAVIDSNGRVQAPELINQGPVKNWVVRERPVETGAGTGVAPGDGVVPASRIPDLPLSRWSEFKKVSGVIVATVPIDHRASFYAEWGDWLPWSCALALVLGMLWPIARRGLPRSKRPAPLSPHVFEFKRGEPHLHGTS